MTKEQLKAHAYDCMVQIERFQVELQKTNQEIARLMEEEDKKEKKT